jgi:hypothetical protein
MKIMEEAMKKYVLTLLVLVITSVVFAVKIGDIPNLMKPGDLKVDGDNLIVVENSTCSIHVYSLKTLELKYKLGSKGEGPGEFRARPFISEVSPNHISGCGWNKVIWFSWEGKMIKEKVFHLQFPGYLEPIKDNYAILERYHNPHTYEAGWALLLLNPQLEKIKELTRVDTKLRVEFTHQDRSKLKLDLIFPVVEKFHCDGKIFLANSIKGFYFDVFDHQGNHLYSIDKNDQVEKIKVDDAYKKRLLNYIITNNKPMYDSYVRKNFLFSKYLAPFKSFRVSDKKIFVVTFKEKDGMRELIVLDLKGKILDRLFLPLKSVKMHRAGGEDTYTVYKGVLYELVDNEKTEMLELHKTDFSDLPTIKK